MGTFQLTFHTRAWEHGQARPGLQLRDEPEVSKGGHPVNPPAIPRASWAWLLPPSGEKNEALRWPDVESHPVPSLWSLVAIQEKSQFPNERGRQRSQGRHALTSLFSEE